MILAVDVHYYEERDLARSAGLLFAGWETTATIYSDTRETRGLQPYQPGSFYLRELPCILPLIKGILATRAGGREPVRTIIVDGYVDLGEAPGLGRRLLDAFADESNLAPPRVVGVAKKWYEGARGAVPVLRGKSESPLYVTASDDLEEAVEGVKRMAGMHRIPELLRKVDLLARGTRIA